MIKTPFYELLKLNRDKGFLAVFFVLLAAVCTFTAISPTEQYITQDCYNELRNAVSNHSQTEIGAILDEKVLEYKVYDALIWGEENAELFSDERAVKYVSKFDDITLRSVDVIGRLTLFEREFEQFYKIQNYSEFLDNAKKSTENAAEFSMFRDENSFSYNSLTASSNAYNKLENIAPIYSLSEGVNRTVSNYALDFALIIIVCFAAIKLFSEEKSSGRTLLSMSYKNGGIKFAAAKLVALFILTLVTCTVFYASVACVNEIRFGLGDLSRAVQSVEGYYASPLSISTFGLLAITALTKAIAALCAAFMASAASVLFKSQQLTFAVSAAFIAINAAMYFFIENNSVFAAIKYASIFSLLDCNTIYCSYLSLDVFGNALYTTVFSWTVGIVLAVIFAAVSVVFYSRFAVASSRKNFAVRTAKIHIGITANELRRIFIGRKGLAVVLAFAAAFTFYLSGINRLLDLDDMMYADYIREIGGEITDETYDFIQTEHKRYGAVNQQMQELSQLYTSGKLSESDFNGAYSSYSQQLMGERSLQHAENQLALVSKNQNAQLIYDTGYSKLLGTEISYTVVPLVFALLLLIILVAPLYSSDNETGASVLLSSTTNGGKALFIRRAIICAITAALTSLAVYSALLFRILSLYGTDGINAPIQSIMQLSGFPFNVSILQYLILLNVAITLIISATAIAMLFISRFCRRKSTAFVFCIMLAAIIIGLQII